MRDSQRSIRSNTKSRIFAINVMYMHEIMTTINNLIFFLNTFFLPYDFCALLKVGSPFCFFLYIVLHFNATIFKGHGTFQDFFKDSKVQMLFRWLLRKSHHTGAGCTADALATSTANILHLCVALQRLLTD